MSDTDGRQRNVPPETPAKKADRFNPDLFRIAQGACRKTQKEVAIAVEVSQGKVSKWEDGILCPSDDEAERAANFLEFPVAFFYQPDAIYGADTSMMYHRKRKRVSAAMLGQLHDQLNVLRVGLIRLLRNVDEIPVRFEHMDIDDYESPEQVARFVRAAWQMPFGPIRNLVELVESMGGIVFQFRFGTTQIDAVGQWPWNTPPLFFVNSEAPADRQRFSLAHEVAHVIMHRMPTEKLEEEADRFASEFLMPEKDIVPDFQEGVSVSKALRLKHKWRVSMQSLIRRARDTNAITQRHYTSLFQMLSRFGYRKREPEPIAPEFATTTQRLVDVHLRELNYSVDEVGRAAFLNDRRFKRFFLREEKGGPFRVVG